MKTVILKVEVPDDFPVDNNTTCVVEIHGVDGDGDRFYNDYNKSITHLPTYDEITEFAKIQSYTPEKHGFKSGANWVINKIKSQ